MLDILKGGLSRRSFLAGTGAAAIGFSVMPKDGWAAEEKKLNFYNWDTYIGETTLDDFKGASGVEVKMSLFADNGELFAKLKEGNPGFDVIVPGADYVDRMIKANLLQKLDHSKIPNFAANATESFKNPVFDPHCAHHLPYMWGTMGIGYRKSKIKGEFNSWKDILESDKYKGRIALISEASTMLGIASLYLGNSINPRSVDDINAAADLLIKQKGNIKVIAQDNGQDLLASGEVDFAIEWNGDINQVHLEDPDIGYLIPKEGSMIWQDNLCIPVGAPHPENAHAFLNYVFDAKVGAAIADFIQYGSPNDAARKLLPDSYNKNPITFPSDEVLAKCEAVLYGGEKIQRLIDEAWTRVQAA
jgi:spermidine/putrescine transport system substrate-binding protein